MLKGARARNEEDKALRKKAISDVASELWLQNAFNEITMAEVAKHAGLAKGTLYLYFPSKEELFLALLEKLVIPWAVTLEEQILAAKSSEEAVCCLVESVHDHQGMTRLLSILNGVLEQNSSDQNTLNFKLKLFQQGARIGAAFEQQFQLPTGRGMHLLLYFHALIIGLYQMIPQTNPTEILPSEFSPPPIEFVQELTSSVRALIVGLQQIKMTVVAPNAQPDTV